MTRAALLLLLGALGAVPAGAQTAEVPAIAPAPAAQQAAPPAAAPSPGSRRERARPRDPRDRAWMDGGIPGTGGFSGFGATVTAPRAGPELAPRPNRDIEAPRNSARPPQPGEAAIAPTLIHPRIPGRSDVQDGGVTMRENRLLREPAPGLRVTTPMAW